MKGKIHKSPVVTFISNLTVKIINQGARETNKKTKDKKKTGSSSLQVDFFAF